MADAAAPASAAQPTPTRKTPGVPEKKYKCQFCNRAFSRSEHRSRHERSRKFIYFPTLVHGGVEGLMVPLRGGVVELDTLAHPIAPSLSTFTTQLMRMSSIVQTPKSAPSNARNVGVPLSGETCSCDTTGPSTPKMEECHSSAKSSVVRPPSQRHPRLPPPSGTSNWTRQRWNR